VIKPMLIRVLPKILWCVMIGGAALMPLSTVRAQTQLDSSSSTNSRSATPRAPNPRDNQINTPKAPNPRDRQIETPKAPDPSARRKKSTEESELDGEMSDEITTHVVVPGREVAVIKSRGKAGAK